MCGLLHNLKTIIISENKNRALVTVQLSGNISNTSYFVQVALLSFSF